MELYFVGGNDNKRLVSYVDNVDEAVDKIKEFCEERDYKIPYWRSWGNLDNNGITYDVGSWSQFFKLVK